METEVEITEKIMRITTVIRENYPELLKYLNEKQVMVPNETLPDETVESLSIYYESLLTFFRNYVAEHQLQNSNRVYKDHHL